MSNFGEKIIEFFNLKHSNNKRLRLRNSDYKRCVLNKPIEVNDMEVERNNQQLLIQKSREITTAKCSLTLCK